MKKNGFINATAALGRDLVYAYLRIMFRPKVCYQNSETKKEIENGGVIFVSNHVGHNDGQMYYMLFKNSMLIMAKDWADKKIVKWVTSGGRFIPVDRFGIDITWIRDAADHLKSGDNVIIFPEGHTSKTGVMDEFKPGFAMLAVMSGAKIVPVYNDGEYHRLFGRRLRLYVGEPMELDAEGRGLNAEYLSTQCQRFRSAVDDLKIKVKK